MALTDVIFRTLSKLGFTTKGSELTWTELDENFEAIIDEITSMNTGAVGNIAAYNAGTTYSNTPTTYVSYSGNIYQYINASPQAGITPDSDPLTWQLVSAGVLSHQQNTDTILAQGTANEVSAAEIKDLLTSGVISKTWADLATDVTNSDLIEGRLYHIRDRDIFLQAVDVNKFSIEATYIAVNCDYGASADMLHASSMPAVWDTDTSYWWTEVLTAYPTAGGRTGKHCIYKGVHYRSLTGANTATDPSADATNWVAVADTDATYIREVESINYNFDTDVITYRADKRGNRIRKTNSSPYALRTTFQFGNDAVTNNIVEAGHLDISGNHGMLDNLRVDGEQSLITIERHYGIMRYVHFHDCVNFSIVDSTIAGTLTSCNFENCPDFVVNANAGSISNCIFRSLPTGQMIANEGTIDSCSFTNFAAGIFSMSMVSGFSITNSRFDGKLWYIANDNNTGIILSDFGSNIKKAVVLNSATSVVTLEAESVATVEFSGGVSATANQFDHILEGVPILVKIKSGHTLTLTYNTGNIPSPDGTASDVFVGASGHWFSCVYLNSECIITAWKN